MIAALAVERQWLVAAELKHVGHRAAEFEQPAGDEQLEAIVAG
jgi:hypothetical protein